MKQKIVAKFELRFARIYRALKEAFLSLVLVKHIGQLVTQGETVKVARSVLCKTIDCRHNFK